MRVELLHRTIHPQYDSNTFDNNLAILKLPLNISYAVDNTVSSKIKPIRLPPISLSKDTFVESVGQVSGFGQLNERSPVSDSLRYAIIRVIQEYDCIDYFGDNVVNYRTICTVGQDKSTQGACHNDNGSPLVIYIPEPTLIGIVSFFGSSGCDGKDPVGYVRITEYITWLATECHLPIGI